MTSSPVALLERLTGLGATVSVNGDRLHIEAPGAVPDDLLAALREHKAEILRLAHLLSMPLDTFASEGQPLEVRVPWLDVTLWIVPTDLDAARLMAEGISRGRIWTARELMQLMAVIDPTLDRVVRTLTHTKLELGGEIAAVRPRHDPDVEIL